MVEARGRASTAAARIANPSLFLDEVAVARSILDRSLWDLLTSPLANDQVAPKGFLLAEKLAVSGFGPSDYVLRIRRLVSARIALIAFWRVATLVLEDLAAAIRHRGSFSRAS